MYFRSIRYTENKVLKPYTSPFEHTHHKLVLLVPPLLAVGTARVAFNKQTKQVYTTFSAFSVQNTLLFTERNKIYTRDS